MLGVSAGLARVDDRWMGRRRHRDVAPVFTITTTSFGSRPPKVVGSSLLQLGGGLAWVLGGDLGVER